MISLEEALKKKSDQDNILNELLMEKLNTVRGIIRLNIQSSDSYDKFIKQYNKVFQCSITDILMWENLYPLFNKLHDNIGEKLNKFHPTLTEKELQLCCLIRAKFRQDEIAHILSYEYNSIKTIKMRLRMKLGFESNDSFIQFLHSL
jgi:DNA-binding CsgD family transcriptional regulator